MGMNNFASRANVCVCIIRQYIHDRDTHIQYTIGLLFIMLFYCEANFQSNLLSAFLCHSSYRVASKNVLIVCS